MAMLWNWERRRKPKNKPWCGGRKKMMEREERKPWIIDVEAVMNKKTG